MRGRLWRIVAPHFVAGLVVDEDRVVEAAPILRWAVGMRWSGHVKPYLRRRGWSGEPTRAGVAA